MPWFCGAQVAPAAAAALLGQLSPAPWSAWVISATEPMAWALPRLMVTVNGPLSVFQPMAPEKAQVPDGETWPSVSLPA